ncbi:hypothetical protein Hanom_Chr04g00333341 [Helianthus anomalus]
MSTHSIGIPDFFHPRQQGGSAGAGARFDPDRQFRVFCEGSSGAGGRQEGSEETANEHGKDQCGDDMRMQQLTISFV